MMTDLSEPLVLLILGHHSPPGDFFKSSLQEGLDKRDFEQLWAVEPRDGNLVLVHKEDKRAVELEKSQNFWMRSWDVWRSGNPTMRFRKRAYTHVSPSTAPDRPSALPEVEHEI